MAKNVDRGRCALFHRTLAALLTQDHRGPSEQDAATDLRPYVGLVTTATAKCILSGERSLGGSVHRDARRLEWIKIRYCSSKVQSSDPVDRMHDTRTWYSTSLVRDYRKLFH